MMECSLPPSIDSTFPTFLVTCTKNFRQESTSGSPSEEIFLENKIRFRLCRGIRFPAAGDGSSA